MSLISEDEMAQLILNGSPDNIGKDHFPVLKLFLPDDNTTFLLTEIHAGDNDLAYALCDRGYMFPELGYVRLSEIAALRGSLGMCIVKDEEFVAYYPISIYARAALINKKIECNKSMLSCYEKPVVYDRSTRYMYPT